MSKKYKIIFSISLIVNLVFIICFSVIAYIYTGMVKGPQPYYYDRTSLFKNLDSITNTDIIMLGDSITNRCEWNELMEKTNIKNRGINSDVVNGVYDRLDYVTKGKPKKIFLLIGVNNLGDGDKVDKIENDYRRVVEKIKKDSPNTQLILQSCFPVNRNFFATVSFIKEKDIVELNERIKNIAKDNNLEYVDIYTSLQGNKDVLNEKYTHDGLHLNGNGYLVWKDIIKKYMN